MATIRERNGHYSVIYNYKDAGGNRKQKWETYNTLAEAKLSLNLTPIPTVPRSL